MIQQQAQLLELYRAGMRTAADAAKASLENVERLQDRQLRAIRGALEENAKASSELAQVRSLDELMALQTRLAGAQVERMVDFWASLWRASGEGMEVMRSAANQVQAVERRPEQHRKSA
ncbi:MAG: phasin family protein [Betaproteobacteria bacterium]